MQIVKYIDRTPINYEKLTVTTGAVVRLTEEDREAARAMFLTVETNSIRYRIEGGDPDIDDGHIVIAGSNLYFANEKAIKELRMIAVGNDATVIVTYYF